MGEAKPAATVMVCRKWNNQIELLMVKRSRRSGFFPNAWVFPGGRVDEADQQASLLGSSPNSSCSNYAVAAIRECYEESGVWLGEGVPDQGFRDKLNNRQANMGDAPHLKADLSRMALWSWWITPKTEPKRYDTRFFLTCLNPQESSLASPDQSETVESCWISPARAISLHRQGVFFLAPPTLITLIEMAAFSTLEALWKAACKRDVEPIMPVHQKENGRLRIIFPGHPNHPVLKQKLFTSSVVFDNGIWRMD